jgi:hypothetical protein
VALLGERQAEMTPQDGALRLQSEPRSGSAGFREMQPWDRGQDGRSIHPPPVRENCHESNFLKRTGERTRHFLVTA